MKILLVPKVSNSVSTLFFSPDSAAIQAKLEQLDLRRHRGGEEAVPAWVLGVQRRVEQRGPVRFARRRVVAVLVARRIGDVEAIGIGMLALYDLGIALVPGLSALLVVQLFGGISGATA